MKTILSAIDDAMHVAIKQNIEPRYATFGQVKMQQLYAYFTDLEAAGGWHVTGDETIEVNGMKIYPSLTPGIVISAQRPKKIA